MDVEIQLEVFPTWGWLMQPQLYEFILSVLVFINLSIVLALLFSITVHNFHGYLTIFSFFGCFICMMFEWARLNFR